MSSDPQTIAKQAARKAYLMMNGPYHPLLTLTDLENEAWLLCVTAKKSLSNGSLFMRVYYGVLDYMRKYSSVHSNTRVVRPVIRLDALGLDGDPVSADESPYAPRIDPWPAVDDRLDLQREFMRERGKHPHYATIFWRIAEGETQRQIAKDLNLSEARVSQIISKRCVTVHWAQRQGKATMQVFPLRDREFMSRAAIERAACPARRKTPLKAGNTGDSQKTGTRVADRGVRACRPYGEG